MKIILMRKNIKLNIYDYKKYVGYYSLIFNNSSTKKFQWKTIYSLSIFLIGSLHALLTF